jgi:predicted ATP-grasp superfamily ATP-dependent carboligase
MFSDLFVASVLSLLRKLNVKRYCLIGGMYDAVPHTRPTLISGTTSKGIEDELSGLGILASDYEGPTSITVLISQEAPQYGIDTMSMVAHLPQYSEIEDDYTAQLSLLEMLTKLYQLPLDLEGVRRKAEKQYKKLNTAMLRQSDGAGILSQLEAFYDSRFTRPKRSGETTQLSPSIEKFLKEIGRELDSDT